MIKACLFDLDGVIVDTAKFHFLAWKQLANSLGIDFTESHNEKLKGVGRMESLDFILGIGNIHLDKREKERLATEKNEHYKSLISNLKKEEILPGVKNFLDELKSRKIKIGLGSSSKNARPVLKNLDLVSYFDIIIDGTNITKSKPDPEVFLLGSEGLGVNPGNIVVFEDAQAGIEAANEGGFISVGVGSENDLHGAVVVIPGFENLGFDTLKAKLEA